MKRLPLAYLFVATLATCNAFAQAQRTAQPCPMEAMVNDADTITSCPTPGIPITPPGTFSASPFTDACLNGICPSYGDSDGNTVSLYGVYGNDENNAA